MYRLYIPIAFVVLFLGWFLYRLLITKDIKKHLNELYMGLIFMGVWALIYMVFLR